jgi:hypothetical protein
MPLLTLEGFEVPVVPGTEVGDEMWGDYARAYSSVMRSDRRASNRIIPVSGSIFDTADDAVTLRAILNTPGKVLAGGTLIGDDAYFHVRNLRMTPVTVDRLSFRFELHESADSPSPLLFTFDGDAPGSYTFTRSGTVGSRTNSAGLLRGTAANVPRREHLWTEGDYAIATRPDTAGLLLEPARTNLASSDNFDSGWTSSGSPVITSGITDPTGGSSAYRIADDAAGASEEKTLTVTFTGNAVKSCVFVVREATMATSGVQRLYLFDSSAAAYRLQLDISAWVAGVPTVAATTGTFMGKRYVGNGYWAIYGESTSVTAANTNFLGIQPAVTAAATGSIDVYRANAYNALTPAWSILDASESLVADTWYAPYTALPMAHSGYVRFTDGMQPTWDANYRVLQIGDADDNAPALKLYRTSGVDSYTMNWVTSAGSVTSAVDLNPAWGDDIELFWTQTAAGVVTLYGRKNSGSITSGSASSALALTASFSAQRLYLSHPNAPGAAVFRACKIIRGVQSTAYIADVARGRLHPRTADHGSLFDMSASVAGAATTSAVEAP